MLASAGLKKGDLARLTLNEAQHKVVLPKKFGAYWDDLEAFNFARQKLKATGFPEQGQTLEALLMDWADDISYAVHDAEDFFRVGWIPLDRLKKLIPAKDTKVTNSEVVELIRGVLTGWDKTYGTKPTEAQVLESAQLIRDFPLERPFGGSPRERVAVRSWASTLIGRFVVQTSFDSTGLTRAPEILRDVAFLKQLTRRYVYGSPLLKTHQHGQKQILRQLFWMYFSEVRRGNPDVLPAAARAGAPLMKDDSSKARYVADLIAGMSEVHAIRAHRRLMGIELGPLEDPAIS